MTAAALCNLYMVRRKLAWRPHRGPRALGAGAREGTETGGEARISVSICARTTSIEPNAILNMPIALLAAIDQTFPPNDIKALHRLNSQSLHLFVV